jgi:hypothetical protein
MSTATTATTATTAAARLKSLRAAPPEMIPQEYDSWLQVATSSQVRRHWRRWMGAFPAWAKA